LTFNPYQVELPVVEIIDDVKSKLKQHQTLIVNAPPGAGKSTLLPLTLLQEEWLNHKKIMMLEPRRLAAKTIAYRMADLLGEPVGETIGYRIRFEQKTSATTRLEVVTEGILTRLLQQDNALEDVGLVIFDEFHERSLHADLALALCREAQQVLRPDLRIMVMSATLNMAALEELLQAPVSVSKGKQYPVEIHYTGQSDLMLLPELTAKTVFDATKKHEGDALVFLPGEAEIKRTAELLEKELSGFSIHPLYGQLPPAAQMAAIMPNRNGKRKVVLATSIAETSLTIEGIKIVVDCGLSRVSRFDPKSGLSRLETVSITKDSADQRAGRAGRLSAGVCYRMWSKATHDRLSEHRIPEIEEADLTGLMLELFAWGISDIYALTWLTPPPKAAVAMAIDTLQQLHAIEGNKVTKHGKALHQLPCHPRIAHMLLKAQENHSVALAADIAAVLEERDPLPKDSGIDINLRIEVLRRNREVGKLNNRLARIEKIAAQYRNLLKVEPSNEPVDVHETGLLLAHAYPERIACARTGNNAQFQLANGKIATAGHKDDLAHESWLAVAHMDARDGLGKIFLASPLNPKDLISMVREKEVITWDARKGGVIANRELRIGNIVLKSTPIPNPSNELVQQAIIDAIKQQGESLLQIDDAFIQLQHRILSLRNWNTQEDWPDVNTEQLLLVAEVWLAPYLHEVKKPEDLKRIDLKDALLNYLGWDKQQLLNKLAPEKIQVPSGSNIRLEYFAHGETPVLAVRLQEVFGLAETPKINNGQTGVVLHLLSPGYKPVQVTADLKSFWNNTYYEVKKELQRRYPKHAWPDEPWEAKAVAKGGVKR
jgi:ATP-dependent helicase HrpB